MHRDASGLIDDDHLVAFVDHTDRLGGDGRFMAVQGVTDHVAVFDGNVKVEDWLAVEHDAPGGDGFFVVCQAAVAEFGGEDVEEGAVAPALFAVRVVGVVVGGDAPEVGLEVVRARPGVAGGDGDGWGWGEVGPAVDGRRVDGEGGGCESHAWAWVAAFSCQVGSYAGGGSQ